MWSALRESNSRHLVKSQVHSHYAKSGVDRLEGLKPPSCWFEPSRSIQLSYRRMWRRSQD